MVVSAGRNTWMMVVSVVDSRTGVMFPVLWRSWWMLLLLLRHRARLGNVRRWNARQMGQMRWRNLMGRRRRWRMRHMGMSLLLLGLGWMSVNHPTTEPSGRRWSTIPDHGSADFSLITVVVPTTTLRGALHTLFPLTLNALFTFFSETLAQQYCNSDCSTKHFSHDQKSFF